MKNPRLKFSALLPFILVSSCVNPDYDLTKEIKTEATLFENITAPVGDLSKMTIDQILFAENLPETIKMSENGDYSLDFISGSFESTVDIPEFQIYGMRLEDQIIHFNLPSSLIDLGASNLVIKYSDLVSGGLSFNMDIEVDSHLPTGMIDVDDVYLDGQMTWNFSVNEGNLYISEGFTMTFPDYIYIAKSKERALSSYVVDNQHTIRFVEDTEVSASSPLSLSLTLNKIIVPDKAIVDGTSGVKRILLNDYVAVNGDFYLKSQDYDVIPEEILLNMHVGIENLKVTKAKVSMDLSSEIPEEEFNLSELPELLQGDDIIVDLYNPCMELSLNNQSPFDFYVTGDITAINSKGSNDIHLGAEGPLSTSGSEIFVPALSAKDFYLSRRAMSNLPAGSKNIEIPAIANLLKDIPDRVKIHNMNIYPLANNIIIEAGASYDIIADYNINAPLSFGAELNLVFTQEITDLALAFDGVKVQSAELKMDIANSIPVDFSIEAICVDSQGKELIDTQLSMDKNVKAGSVDSPTVNSITVKLDNKHGILDVDGLILTMKALAADPAYHGICLNKNQGFEIKNIILSLPNGVGVEF